MGVAKAGLEWHGSTLLRRVVGLLSRGVDGPVVVIRAPGQPLPALPPRVDVLDDPTEGLGPLQGLAIGLSAVCEQAPVAFVCSTDLPFLHPLFVRRVTASLGDGHDIAMPHVGGFRQPLTAAYATALAGLAAELVAEGHGAPRPLLERARTLVLDDTALAGLDLRSVENLNTTEQYAAARAEPPPEVVVQRYGVLASGGQSGSRTVRAATVGAAAEAVGLVLDRHVLAAVNGDQTSRDPHTPLLAGDVVALLSADAGG